MPTTIYISKGNSISDKVYNSIYLTGAIETEQTTTPDDHWFDGEPNPPEADESYTVGKVTLGFNNTSPNINSPLDGNLADELNIYLKDGKGYGITQPIILNNLDNLVIEGSKFYPANNSQLSFKDEKGTIILKNTDSKNSEINFENLDEILDVKDIKLIDGDGYIRLKETNDSAINLTGNIISEGNDKLNILINGSMEQESGVVINTGENSKTYLTTPNLTNTSKIYGKLDKNEKHQLIMDSNTKEWKVLDKDVSQLPAEEIFNSLNFENTEQTLEINKNISLFSIDIPFTLNPEPQEIYYDLYKYNLYIDGKAVAKKQDSEIEFEDLGIEFSVSTNDSEDKGLLSVLVDTSKYKDLGTLNLELAVVTNGKEVKGTTKLNIVDKNKVVAPKIQGATIQDNRKEIKVTVDKDLKATNIAGDGGFKLKEVSNPVTNVKVEENNKKEIILTLTDELQDVSKVKIDFTGNEKLELEDGIKLENKKDIQIEDKRVIQVVAPKIQGATIQNNRREIKIKVDKDLKATNIAGEGGFELKGIENPVTNVKVEENNKKEIILTLTDELQDVSKVKIDFTGNEKLELEWLDSYNLGQLTAFIQLSNAITEYFYNN